MNHTNTGSGQFKKKQNKYVIFILCSCLFENIQHAYYKYIKRIIIPLRISVQMRNEIQFF